MEFVSPNPMRPISEQAYLEAAEDIGCDVAAVKAVAEVEARGNGFLSDGRPKILFERHKFRKYTRGQFNETHPSISGPPGGYQGGAAEYGRLKQAIALDREAALLSASWGRFQIMGFNHEICGYPDVEDFVRAMVESEDRHLQAFIAFVEGNHLDRHLRNLDWAKFAKGYNGPDFRKNQYDTKMAAAYEKYAGLERPTPIGTLTGGLGASGGPGGAPVSHEPFTIVSVEDVQTALTVLNFDPKGIDNKLGKNTKAAIREFQRSVHLPDTGELNSELRAALQAAYYMHQRYGSADVVIG
jgi:hypothetical protein